MDQITEIVVLIILLFITIATSQLIEYFFPTLYEGETCQDNPRACRKLKSK